MSEGARSRRYRAPAGRTRLVDASRQLKAMRERWKIWRTAIEGWKPGTEWRDPEV